MSEVKGVSSRVVLVVLIGVALFSLPLYLKWVFADTIRHWQQASHAAQASGNDARVGEASTALTGHPDGREKAVLASPDSAERATMGSVAGEDTAEQLVSGSTAPSETAATQPSPVTSPSAPAAATNAAVVFSSSESHPYVVQSGDTLHLIAQREYGDAALWFHIAAANHLGSPDTIQVGQTLQLPVLLDRHVDTGSATFESGYWSYHNKKYAIAIRMLKRFLAGPDGDPATDDIDADEATRSEAIWLLANSHIKVVDAHRWLPREATDHSNVPEVRENLGEARRLFEDYIVRFPSGRRANQARRWLPGLALRFQKWQAALDGFRELRASYPDPSAIDDDLDFCLMAMARYLADLDVAERAKLVEVALETSSIGQVLGSYDRVLEGMRSEDFLSMCQLLTDSQIAEAFYGSGMPDLPLRITGLHDGNVDSAVETAKWLAMLGHYESSVAIAEAIQARVTLARYPRHYRNYLRALLEVGRDRDALRFALKSNMPESVWYIASEWSEREHLQELSRDETVSASDRALLAYVLALRDFGSCRFDDAWRGFWQIITEMPSSPVRPFAQARLFEVYPFLHAGAAQVEQSSVRLVAGNAERPFHAAAKVWMSLLGADSGDDALLGDVTSALGTWDRVEAAMYGSKADERGTFGLQKKFDDLVSEVVASDSFDRLPVASRDLIADLPLLYSGEHEPDGLRRRRWNRWMLLFEALSDLAPVAMMRLDIRDEAQFRAVLGPAIDTLWNVIRLRMASDFGTPEAGRWHVLGRYIFSSRAFARPGTWWGPLNSPLGAVRRDPPTDVDAESLALARFRLAGKCFEHARQAGAERPEVDFNVGLCEERLFNSYREQMNEWRLGAIRAGEKAGLLAEEDADQLRSGSPAWVTRAVLATMPRGARIQQHGERAMRHFRLFASGRWSDHRLADDAAAKAGTIAGFGLGLVDDAVHYYSIGAAMAGDQRGRIEFLQQYLLENGGGEPEPTALASLSALLLMTGSDEFEVASDPGLGAIRDKPFGAYVELRANLARHRLDDVARLIDIIAHEDWRHRMVPYLLELWYSALPDDAARRAMLATLTDKLRSQNLGASRFYVRLLSVRVANELGDWGVAEEGMQRFVEENPFHGSAALGREVASFQQRAGRVPELNWTAPADAPVVDYLFIGYRLESAR